MKKLLICLAALCFLMPNNTQAQNWEHKLEDMKYRLSQKLQAQQRRVDMKYEQLMRRVWTEVEMLQMPEPPSIPEPVEPYLYDPNLLGDRRPSVELDAVPKPMPDKAPTPTAHQRPRPTHDELEELEIIIRSLADEPVEVNPLAPSPEPTEEELPNIEIVEEVEFPAEEELDVELNLMEREIKRLDQLSTFGYYGQEMKFRYDAGMYFELEGDLSEDVIAQKWEQLNRTRYDLIEYQLILQAGRLKLNDWGYCLLVNDMARMIYPNSRNAQTIFTLFMMQKSGYAASACYTPDRLYLMLASNDELYSTSYLFGKGNKYYILDPGNIAPKVRKAKVLNGKYPQSDRQVSFNAGVAPNLPLRKIEKSLRFEYRGQKYNFPVTINENVVKYYEKYPFTDMHVMFSTPLSPTAHETLVPQLKKMVAGKPETEQVNMILRFTQKAFDYQTDDENFGYENYLFPEETLYNSYSDCEDRSALFAYLVHAVTGLRVIAIESPDHVATAVRFSQEVDGDRITFKGDKYVICDPTYINADYGMCAPSMLQQQVEVIDFMP